jgi:zinc protease
VIRQDLDNPGIRAGETLQTLLYGEAHPYGRPAKGTLEIAQRLTRRDLQEFHAQRFSPESTSLVVVGDVDPNEAFERIDRAFGSWDAATVGDREVPPVTIDVARRRVELPMPGKPQSDIAYGFVTINRLHPAYYAYWVMNNILGQFGLGGRLVIRAGVDPNNVERAIGAIDVEVRALGEDGPTDRELRETRQFLIGSIPRMLETNQSIATFLQTSEFFGLGLDYDRRLPHLLEAVTLADVAEAATAVLHPDRAAIAVAGPSVTSAG